MIGSRLLFFGLAASLLAVPAMADVKAGTVEGRVGVNRAEDLTDRLDATLGSCVGGFDDDGCRAHPDDHAVAAPVEWRRGVFNALVRRRSAGGEEARSDPGQEVVARRVIGGYDDDPTATT